MRLSLRSFEMGLLAHFPRGLLVALLVCAHAVARGDALELPAVGARAAARAGAGLLSTDGGDALHYNPAGLARRTVLRVQLGLAAVRRTLRFDAGASFPGGQPPVVENRAGIALVPWGGLVFGLGDRVVAGVALLAPTSTRLHLPGPETAFTTAADDRRLFPHRYAAERLELERLGGSAGAAVRALPWLAVGAAVTLERVRLEHDLMLWAGPPTAGPNLGDLSPAYDMRFSAAASGYAPGVSGGLVIAPLDLPFEAGLSVTWSAPAHLSGVPSLAASRGLDPDGSGQPAATPVSAARATADLEVPLPTTLRAGARLLLPRVVVELDGEASLCSGSPAWSLAGLAVAPAGAEPVPVARVPLGPGVENGFAARAAVDVDVVPGTVALLGGYAFVRQRVAEGTESPLFPDADAHVLALGIEGRVAGATATLGVLHAFRPATDGGGGLRVIDPRGTLDTRAAAGSLSSSTTLVALDVEVSFEP